ncbi:MAG: RHS repeat domain-containing protein, partial [Cyanobacteriota bacterium]|nr:RHS repeat domain-containing protein [Cyanobacteriota bacterium]
MEKESYYDSNGNFLDETTYTYDAAGNRQSASNGEAKGTYTYDNTHQLTGIDTGLGTEIYAYDEGGRVKQVLRDGETLNLFYNDDDLIVKVTDVNGNTVVEYEYDSNGRRVEVSDSTGERDYLVAPNLGNGLESPHLIADGDGNALASYVYGGSMPLMRLDALGNPVYYLEDGMGSVIG